MQIIIIKMAGNKSGGKKRKHESSESNYSAEPENPT